MPIFDLTGLNKTQRIAADWLIRSGLVDGDLLLEALLWRGFLAFVDQEGVWLGTGAHELDIRVLAQMQGLDVQPVQGNSMRACRIQVKPECHPLSVALQIVSLGENHADGGLGHFTTVGLGHYMTSGWRSYNNMRWGAQLPVCPAEGSILSPVSGALDLGVALLVKVLPLVRVATSYSCDGHGIGPAQVGFHYPWDAPWLRAVLEVLAHSPCESIWEETDFSLSISPVGGYGDGAVLGMMRDVQTCARQLMAPDTITRVGLARMNTLNSFEGTRPHPSKFTEVARSCLAEAFLAVI